MEYILFFLEGVTLALNFGFFLDPSDLLTDPKMSQESTLGTTEVNSTKKLCPARKKS